MQLLSYDYLQAFAFTNTARNIIFTFRITEAANTADPRADGLFTDYLSLLAPTTLDTPSKKTLYHIQENIILFHRKHRLANFAKYQRKYYHLD